MEYSIQELRAMHQLSKPELTKALSSISIMLDKENIPDQAKMALAALSEVCISYDQTMDVLFSEIDRLNEMEVDHKD